MENNMYFFIADISGYTAFMLQNKMDYDHGTLMITELMSTLVKKVKVPFEISKLEGDALFLYLPEDKISKKISDQLGEKILEFFDTFSDKLKELKDASNCTCGGCSNMSLLNLKIVGHYGKAAINKIGSFKELSGVDVILVHRLLKNQLNEKRYLLLTQPAYEKLRLPPEAHMTKAEEMDKDLGTIPIYVYYPPQNNTKKTEVSGLKKFGYHCKLVLGTLLLNKGMLKPGPFHNLPPKE